LNTSSLRNAIDQKQVLEFRFKDNIRIVEPHIYGIKNQRKMLLVYQIGGGTTSGAIPDWRLVPIDEIKDLRQIGEKFTEKREPPSGDYNTWDVIISKTS
jgi:hypothetical protein